MSAGSGRNYSCTDIVLLDTSAAQEVCDRPALTVRVFGNGEGKGNWQFHMEDNEELENALNNPKKVKKVLDTIQQMFGDMVLDESKYGFVSNYNQTILFRRAAIVAMKTLEYSPVVKIGSTPLVAFLYVLVEAYNHQGDKNRLGRSKVSTTPSKGYVLTFPVVIEVTSIGRRTSRVNSMTVCAKRAQEHLGLLVLQEKRRQCAQMENMSSTILMYRISTRMSLHLRSDIFVNMEAFQNEVQEMEDMLASLVAEIAVE
ncbi:hypothetical protein GOP47_0004106 [Adiantum capillus-veneris]|uniref:Uncharacterized protein n=1 Tax=Adiantum capillus-veneris TaxID=13818 RepID=A0A9D4V789_ADICA|nr:hypothetical protein GOP47_0004106 [Adiantum capillus-veneris]